MQRATRTNLLLVAIAAALGMAVYLQIGEEVADFEPPLSSLDLTAINAVTVNCLHCVPRRFVRSAGHWSMLAPYVLPADDAKLTKLLSIAASPVRTRHPGNSFDAHKIGLDPPLMGLQLDDQQFDIGVTDALLGDRYVRVGESIAMVPDRFSPFLVASAESELDRQLVPRGETLEDVLIDGVSQPALVAAWRDAVASAITQSPGAAQSVPSVRVDLKLAGGQAVTYRFYRTGDEVVILREEPALSYSIDPEQVIKLLGQADGAKQ